MTILEEIAFCVEKGKADLKTPYPADMNGKKGALELTQEALASGIDPKVIMAEGLLKGMQRLGEEFSAGKAFVPNLLIGARAVKIAMVPLAACFTHPHEMVKGSVILGTVKGDLHDIGKNIVRIILEGDGWRVVDLGVDVSAEKFSQAIREEQVKFVGLSAMLTTTMLNMKKITHDIKNVCNDVKVFIGGAPESQGFNDAISADGYFRDPHSLIKHLNSLVRIK